MKTSKFLLLNYFFIITIKFYYKNTFCNNNQFGILFNNIKIYSLKIFLLVCLFILCACDNRKGICIEADDFGFEDIERFDVLSFRSANDQTDECSYKILETGGFSSFNKDLLYCLNGAQGVEHCEESYDGYINIQGQNKNCRFLNNDIANELTLDELSCVKPNDTNYKNKGCNFKTKSEAAQPIILATNEYLFSSSSTWQQPPTPPSNPLNLVDVQNQCIDSCVQRCRKHRACSHVASRLQIKNGATDVAISSARDSFDEYDIFNPYTGKSILKHDLDGNLFIVNSSLNAKKDVVQDDFIYTFSWDDSGSELKTIFSKLQNPAYTKKLALAIAIAIDEGEGKILKKQILIDNFDSCNLSRDTFTCQIKVSDLIDKAEFKNFFITAPTSTSTVINDAKAIAIFDYVKIKQQGGINTNDRTITTDTQHHFGTNSNLEIVSSSNEYKIKVKQITNSQSFIYEDINSPPQILSIKALCEQSGENCFLIPSVEDIDWQDKFMPPWKSTTLKFSPNSSGGLQISAGSKVEIQATGEITLGTSTTSLCHLVSNTSLPDKHIYGFSLLGEDCATSKTMSLKQKTQYKPNVSLDIASVSEPNRTKINFYRPLKNSEKAAIAGVPSDDDEQCQNSCYIKIHPQTTISQTDFACETSSAPLQCQYKNQSDNRFDITTKYESEKEQVKIANYTRRVVVAAVSPPKTEQLVFSNNTASEPQDVSFTSDSGNYVVALTYDKLREKITNYDVTGSPYKDDSTLIPLYVKLIIPVGTPAACMINISLTDFNKSNYPVVKDGNDNLIIYPNTTLKITTKTTVNCNGLKYTVHPFVLFTATQSGFVKFNTQNACSLQKAARVVNNNKSYPKKYRINKATGGEYYASYDPSQSSGRIAEYNLQGTNGINEVCDNCFDVGATPLTKIETPIICPSDTNGCGGQQAELDLTKPAQIPENGKQGKVVIEFLDGQSLTYDNQGVYHLTIQKDSKITKITIIGGGGGASYNYTPASLDYNIDGRNATELTITNANGFKISANSAYYTSPDFYTLKIIVGAGGKNSTEVNPYRFFAGGSHRESQDYNVYKKEFGYAGGGGEASVIALVKPATKTILPLVVAGGGGGGSGKTCNATASISGGTIIEGEHILHNADYAYLKKIIQCPSGILQQNIGVSKVDCGNSLGGLPGYCPGFMGCPVNLGTIPNWQAYKATVNVTLLRINIPTINSNISCNTGYAGTPKYTCKTEQGQNNFLALSGCYPNTGSTQLTPSLWLEAKDNPLAAFGGSAAPANRALIDRWKSQSPDALGGNAIEVNQASETNRPVYISNGINSFPTLQFDSSDNLSNLNISVDKLLGNLASKNTATLFVVQQVNNNTNSKSFKLYYSDQQFALRAYDSNSLFFDFGVCCDSSSSSINKTAFTNQPTILSVKKQGNNLYAYQNSQLLVQSTANAATSTITIDPTVSTALNIASVFDGKISEVLVYKEALTDPQITAVENYLKAKWNIASGCSASTLLNGNHGVKTIYMSGETATCNTGYSSSTAPTNPTCNNGIWSASCTLNICTAPSVIPTGYTLPSGFTYSYTGLVTSREITGASCATGYRGTPVINYFCNKTNSNPTSATIQSASGCTINTCTVPATTGYSYSTNPVNYGSGSISASCTTGYNGTATVNYTCDNTSSNNDPIDATINASNCNANICNASISNGTYNGIAKTIATGQTNAIFAEPFSNHFLCNKGYGNLTRGGTTALCIDLNTQVNVGSCSANSCSVALFAGNTINNISTGNSYGTLTCNDPDGAGPLTAPNPIYTIPACINTNDPYQVCYTESNNINCPNSSTTYRIGTCLPTDITITGNQLTLWLDASDLDTITKDSSNKVSAWSSKVTSANGSATIVKQSTSANQPTYNATGFDGISKPSLSFDGTLTTNNSLFTDITNTMPITNGSGQYTLIAVYKPTATSGYYVIMEQNSSSSTLTTGTRAGMMIVNSNPNFSGQNIDRLDNTSGYPSITNNNPYITAIVVNKTISLPFSFYNNSPSPNNLAPNANSQDLSSLSTGNTYFVVGRKFNNAEPYSGHIAELLIYNNALNQAQINGIQNYLAEKWSLPKVCNGTTSATGYTGVAGSFTHNQSLTCNTGYSGTITVNCTRYGSTATINGNCTANTCTASLSGSFGTGAVTSTSITTATSLASTNTTLANSLLCGTGYSKTWTGSGTAICTNPTTNITVGSCAINTCTVPATTGYSNLPANVNYTATSQPITGASCATGYTGTPVYTCFSGSVGSSTQATLSGCTANTCTASLSGSFGAGATTSKINSITTGQILPTTISGLSCGTGYSLTTTGSGTALCTNSGTTNITVGSCAINTCIAPSVIPAGYTLPSVFTYNYTGSTPQAIGLSCAAGYSGTATATYTCNNTSGSSTTATISSSSDCNSNCNVVLKSDGSITNWGSYKVYSGTSLSLIHNTTSSSAAGVYCNTGYAGAPQYTCNNGTLALSGCYPNVSSNVSAVLSGLYYETFASLGSSPNTYSLGSRLTSGITTNMVYNWSGNFILDTGRTSNVVIHFTGYYKATRTGNHYFGATTDDGVRIVVNNQLIINDWFDRPEGFSAPSSPIYLNIGDVVPVDIWYYQNGGGAYFAFYESADNSNWSPTANLTANVSISPSLQYETFSYSSGPSPSTSSGTKLTSGIITTMLNNWGSGNVLDTGRSDNVMIHFTGYYKATRTGNHYFNAGTDDGVQITINGNTVFSWWGDRGYELRNSSSPVYLNIGDVASVDIWYYENGGGAVFNFFESADNSNWSSITNLTANFPQQLTPSLWLETKDNPIAAFGGSSAPANGAAISKWKSQSPDALGGSAIEVNQTLSANQPRYSSSGINGYPTLQLDGNDWLSSDVYLDRGAININNLLGNVGSAKNTATLFVVQKVDTITDSGSVVFHGNKLSQRFLFSAYWGGNLYFDFGSCCNYNSSRIGIYSPTYNPIIVSLKKDVNNLYIYQNSQSLIQTPGSDTISDGDASDKLKLDIAWSLNGKIAEVILYKQALTDTQRTAVENYLKAKWNIASGCSASNISNANHGGKIFYFSGETATCNTGYSSSITPTNPTCNNGSWNGSCNINRCGTLANSNYSSLEGVYGNTAICNGSSGYGSSNPGSNPVCQANGTWSANCRWNSCNVNQITGYVGLPATVPNLNNLSYVYYFSPNVPCTTNYWGCFNGPGMCSGAYNCWNTNSNGYNINIDPMGCIQE